MVNAQELGYKDGEMDVGENASYRVLRPRFKSVLAPDAILRKQFEELDALPKDRKWTAKDIDPWMANYFDTSTGAAGTSNELVINPGSEALSVITFETPLVAHGIPMLTIPSTANKYNRADYARYINRGLRENEVADNPFWLEIVAGKDVGEKKEFLGRLAQLKFKLMKDLYRYNEGMGFYFPEDDLLIERALVLGRTDGRANAGGNDDLDCDDARLVGVPLVSAPKISSGNVGGEKTIPNTKVVLPYTLTDVEAAREELIKLQEFVRGDKVASLEALLRKL